MDHTEMQKLRARCRQEAIDAGALEPQGFGESIAASQLSYYQGRSFATTPRAQERLEQWTNERLRQRLQDTGR